MDTPLPSGLASGLAPKSWPKMEGTNVQLKGPENTTVVTSSPERERQLHYFLKGFGL